MRHGVIAALGLLVLLWPLGAHVKPGKAKESGLVIEGYVAKGLFLFESVTNQSTPVTGEPRPNRVHVRYSPEFSDWVFALSDLRGRFPDPPEALVAGSVVGGDQVGASGSQNYLFLSGGRWVPTTDPRKLILVVLGEIPSYKTVTFEPVADSRLEFVNTDRKLNFKTYDPYASR